MQKRFCCLLIFIGIFSWSVTSSAHPHIFITPRAHFAFSGKICTFFSVRWHFDAMSTLELVGTEAINTTLALNGSQQKEILALEGFPRPEQLHHYIQVEIDGSKAAVLAPAAVSLAVNEGRLVYAFTIGVYRPVKETIKIWFNDPSSFIAYETNAGFFTVSQTAGSLPSLRCTHEQYSDRINIRVNRGGISHDN
ncbi:MAG: DUF1007 family protein [Sporomusaceae bacterium]|nr:DUF1007 family protein [Sporomusaceae bacterium]